MQPEKNCQLECPYCGSKDIETYDNEIVDNSLSISYFCDECHGDFTEWYKLIYDGTTYDDEDFDKAEVVEEFFKS